MGHSTGHNTGHSTGHNTGHTNERNSEERTAFPRLDEADVAGLAEIGSRRSLQDGEVLFEAGEERCGFFVVLSGAVKVVDGSGDAAQIVSVHKQGEFTGDVDVLGARRAIVSAVAEGATEVLHIPSGDLNRLLSEQPDLGETILNAFIARRELLMESGFQGLRVIGSHDSLRAFQLCEFLARNQVPHTWIKVEIDHGVGQLLADLGVTEKDLPVVAYGDRPLLRNPSLAQLAEQVGLKSTLDKNCYDLVVIGAGPAGLAAAVYGASEGLRTLVLDGAGPGGQAGASTKIENYLGFPTGITGADLMSRAVLQAQKFGAQFSTPSLVSALDLDGELPTIHIEGDGTVTTKCVLIATGAAYRKLDIPERERFDGLGVYYAATQTELVACHETDVIVVGGGNSAGQAIMFLSQHTRSVTVLLRGSDLYASMSSYLADRIEAAENVKVRYHSKIRRLAGEERLEAVEIEDTETDARETIKTPAVFSFIGAVPCTKWLPAQIETDADGFICTGRDVTNPAPGLPMRDARTPNPMRPAFPMETSYPGVFAAGDVRAGSTKRVSSAVGEGAMAIRYVHEYLSELDA
jgi:thioredoxin reductase (NADPH)